jgi:hypothetical protein
MAWNLTQLRCSSFVRPPRYKPDYHVEARGQAEGDPARRGGLGVSRICNSLAISILKKRSGRDRRRRPILKQPFRLAEMGSLVDLFKTAR